MSTLQTAEHTGRCLCGGVVYEVHGELSSVDYCHCSQCRRTSGHFVAAASCEPDALHLVAVSSLGWYESSALAERGFCSVCGSSLFWRPRHGRHISVMAGTLDAPTGLKAIEHIYVADKSDYYQIADGLPQHAGEPDSS
ncbi:MAG: GFA family protein, partial [Gammaproteobacteria bacterium]|nr:GFA family protein [Gammaproteobacteria bacterium]